MVAKYFGRALALLMVLPSAAFALGLGDIHLLSSLNAPLDAEIELLDVTPEDMQSLKAQIAPRETFARNGLDWPVFLSSVTVRVARDAQGHDIIKLRSSDAITEPFITILVQANWARGQVTHEYTVLLDPPVFTPGQSPASNAPVAAPTVGVGAREGAIARGAQQPPSAQTSSQTQAPAASPSTPDSAAATPSRAPRVSARAPASSTAETQSSHIVRRGETLSTIAAATSGLSANSPQTRELMLAIYQANPSAFEKNMNLLRSGAVLRIPDSAAASAISPAEASEEIRRQYAAWRSSSSSGTTAAAEPGRLRLVTPKETPGAAAGSVGVAASTQALQGRVQQLEGELNESKRLLQLRDTQLAQLQARLQGAKGQALTSPPSPQAVATPPTVASKPAATAPATPAPTAAPAPTAQVPPAPAEVPPAPVASQTPPAATEAAKPAPAPKPAATPSQPAAGGSLLDTLKDYWWAIAALVAVVLALLGLKAWRARRQSDFDDSLGRLAVAGANAAERGFASGDTAPVRPLPSSAGDSAFLVEESGSHERPRVAGGAAPLAPVAKHVATDDTISTDTAINLDQGDPLAEADFHMAYGLYDQAADLIRIAISREPNRRDLKLKLLEVFFVWGNKEQFLQSARELANTRDEAAPGEWEKILIMGKQLAPEDPLFSSGAAVSGAMAGGVDLDLEGGESRIDFDLLGDPIPGHTGGEVDLDIGSALGDPEGVTEITGAATDRSFSLEGTSTGTTRQMTAKISRDPEPLMPDFGTELEGPTVEQPGIETTPGNPTIRQKVAMALKQGHTAEQTAELAIDDLGLDLGALDTIDQPGLGASSDAPTLVAGMDEHSRQVIEDAQRHSATEEREVSATGAWRMDESDLNSILGKGDGKAADSTNYDPSSTARLAALPSSEVDFDLGDADSLGDLDADGSHQRQGSNGSGLDLDVGTATVPDTAFTSTQKLAADDLALPDLEPVTMSEVGTKLDLARAYMDMGDPEGARNILEEVVHEGSVAQKQEAQRLLESLPG